jgi:predicted transcriptional regulator
LAKQKLTVNLTDEVLAVLKDLARQGDRSLTEELRLAIADRKFFADQVREGNTIEVAVPDGSTGDRVRHPVRILV